MGLTSKTLAFVLGFFLFVLPTAQATFYLYGWQEGSNVNFQITGSTFISPFGAALAPNGISLLIPAAGDLQTPNIGSGVNYEVWLLEDGPIWGPGGFVFGNYTGTSMFFINGYRFGLPENTDYVATTLTFAGSFASLGLSSIGHDYRITGADSQTDFIRVLIEAPPNPVPEPASIALLGLAALGGYLILRKKA